MSDCQRSTRNNNNKNTPLYSLYPWGNKTTVIPNFTPSPIRQFAGTTLDLSPIRGACPNKIPGKPAWSTENFQTTTGHLTPTPTASTSGYRFYTPNRSENYHWIPECEGSPKSFDEEELNRYLLLDKGFIEDRFIEDLRREIEEQEEEVRELDKEIREAVAKKESEEQIIEEESESEDEEERKQEYLKLLQELPFNFNLDFE